MTSKRLLVIDDDPLTTSIIVSQFSKDFNVIALNDGTDALETILSEKPHIVLLDLLMPNVSGMKLLEEIRAHFDQYYMPVIMFSSDNNYNTISEALSFGANDYVPKPLRFEILRARINNQVALSISFRQQLEEKNSAIKLAQLKQDFLATMSHEIRTPLNSIIGLVECLQLKPTDSESRRLIETIASSGNLLLDIVNDILDLSKIEANKMTVSNDPFSWKKILKDIETQYAPACQMKGITFEVNIKTDITPHIFGDERKVRQILNNFVGNAIKFTDSGKISLKTTIKRNMQGRMLVFEVMDTGSGIDLNEQNQIFEMFHQVGDSDRKKNQGTGLGLAISKKLAELMGGRIGVRSSKGSGATFWLSIPFNEDNVENNIDYELESIIDEAPNYSQIRIAVIDDNEANLLVAEKMFGVLNLKVDTFLDGLQFFNHLQSGAHYELVLLDCQMPEITGYDLIKKINRELPTYNTPTLGVTASVLEETKNLCLESGMVEVIHKPLRLSILQNLLDRYKSGSLGVAAPSTTQAPLDNVVPFKAREQKPTQIPPISVKKKFGEIIDFHILEELLELSDDEPEFFTSQIEMFHTRYTDLRSQADDDLEKQNAQNFMRTMHAISGSSRLIGAKKLSEIASRLESKYGSANVNESTSSELESIDAEFQAYFDAVNNLFINNLKYQNNSHNSLNSQCE